MAVDISKYVKGITIETSYLPTINIPDPFKPGPPNTFLQSLRPKITIDLGQFGTQEIAPYGEPGPSMWPVIKTSLLILSVTLLARYLINSKK